MTCPRCQLEHEAAEPCAVQVPVPPPVDPRVGLSIGGYTVIRELGLGFAGTVYLAEHAATGLKVAIKFPNASLGPAGVRRLGLEARFANQLALESVVNVFDFSEDEATGAFQVMEYLEGETLRDLVRRKIDPPEALPFLAAIADTLESAHQRGVVHAGLTPSNVVVVADGAAAGQVRLMPFGVAFGPVGPDEELEDRLVARLGAPDWRSPEQTNGAAPDPRMDVYALGTLAYLLATGRPPFQAPTPQALARAHAEVVPEAPHRVNPKVPRAWSAAILRALEKSPEKRFASAAAFAQALREAAVAPAPVPPPPVGAPAPQEKPGEAPERVVGGLAGEFIVTPAPQPVPTSSPSAPPGMVTRAPSDGLVLSASVSDEQGALLGSFPCSAVTRAGLVVCTTGALPPLLSRVRLTFGELDGLVLDAQVVHHVTPEQAAQWKMSPGFGVQFGSLTGEQRKRLEDAHLGLRSAETPSGIARRPDDPQAAAVLARFTGERAADSYGLLGISKSAPFDAIRDRVRDAQRQLDGAETRPLSLAQQKLLHEARARLEVVGGCLGDPLNRLDYDAERGNFEGIARCINAGVTVADLEEARKVFMARRPGVAGKSHASITAAEGLETRGLIGQALDAYAEALRADPLNLIAQQRYWALRRRLDSA